MPRPAPEAEEESDEMLAVKPGKWTLVVISELRGGTRRFNELRRSMGGVPQKSLALTLKELERDGFILRTAFATIPPRVQYELTELGVELLAMADSWRQFARRNRAAVETARLRFDAAQDQAMFLLDDTD